MCFWKILVGAKFLCIGSLGSYMLTKLLSMLTVPRSWGTWLPTSQKHLSYAFPICVQLNH